MKKIIGAIIAFSLLSLPVYGVDQYGELEMKKGWVTIVREGQPQRHETGSDKLKIYKHDLIRMDEASEGLLKTFEDTSITIGSNAIFQVRPWKSRNKTGYLRMLFGKARLKTAKVKKSSRRFRMKTAMAVIGIKGTDWWVQTTADGNTNVITYDGVVGVQGASGEEQDVEKGQATVVINNKAATKSIRVPKKVMAKTETIDSPPATTPESSSITGEDTYIEVGLISETEIVESKQDRVTVEENFDLDQAKTILEEQDAESDDEDFESELKTEEIEEEAIEPETTDIQLKTDEVAESDQTTQTTDQPVVEEEPVVIEVPEIDIEDAKTESLIKSGKIDIRFEK